MLPPKFEWLDDIGPLPKALAVALQYYGIKEIPGLKSNPIILQMAQNIGVADIYKNDDLSWCALFVNNALQQAGKPLVDPKGDRWNLLRALYLLNWGDEVQPGDERTGDVLVFQRPGGGHVGFYIAETKSTFYVYGGNQANAANFTEIAKNRLKGARRLYAIGPPASAVKHFIASSGKVSTNEA
jgi:uncharacterized protein (TIGR02594 family)